MDKISLENAKELMSAHAKRAAEYAERMELARKEYTDRYMSEWVDPTRMSYWYEVAKHLVPTPRTSIIHNPFDIGMIFDNKKPEHWDELVARVMRAGAALGNPYFLRTEWTSAKHSWKDTCYVDTVDPLKVSSHMFKLIEFSAMVDLPFGSFVVREMLRPRVYFHAFWGNMPITREFRVFVKDEKVYHFQNYWPLEAFENQPNDLGPMPSPQDLTKSKVCTPEAMELVKQRVIGMTAITDRERTILSDMAVLINKHLPGDWSIDFLDMDNGNWMMTDMAFGPRSYKHEGI